MEEKRKLSTGVIILILTLIVALTSVTTILIYKEINNKNTTIDNQNQIRNNEPLQISRNEENDNKEENNNLQNLKFKINETIKLNEKECTISVKCDEKIETKTIELEPITYLYYTYNYTVKINGIENKITTENLKFKNIDILTITDAKSKKEYILLKIETNGREETTRVNYYIYDENANEIGKIVNYISDTSWIIDKNDKEYTGNKFYPNELSDKIEIYKYISSENSENAEYEALIKKIEYTIENGKMKEKIVKTYTSSEFEIAGKS